MFHSKNIHHFVEENNTFDRPPMLPSIMTSKERQQQPSHHVDIRSISPSFIFPSLAPPLRNRNPTPPHIRTRQQLPNRPSHPPPLATLDSDKLKFSPRDSISLDDISLSSSLDSPRECGEVLPKNTLFVHLRQNNALPYRPKSNNLIYRMVTIPTHITPGKRFSLEIDGRTIQMVCPPIYNADRTVMIAMEIDLPTYPTLEFHKGPVSPQRNIFSYRH